MSQMVLDTSQVLRERDVTRQHVDWLRAKGWRAFRHQTGRMMTAAGAAVPFGERGMADWSFHFYRERGLALVFWMEMKASDAVLRCGCARMKPAKLKRGELCTPCEQARWRREMVRIGALVIVIGPRQAEKFTVPGEFRFSNIEEFIAWYDNALGWIHKGAVA